MHNQFAPITDGDHLTSHIFSVEVARESGLNRIKFGFKYHTSNISSNEIQPRIILSFFCFFFYRFTAIRII
ncbi:hypothetical protein RhiirC2_733410, partial [Rhizophagus irregularis]